MPTSDRDSSVTRGRRRSPSRSSRRSRTRSRDRGSYYSDDDYTYSDESFYSDDETDAPKSKTSSPKKSNRSNATDGDNSHRMVVLPPLDLSALKSARKRGRSKRGNFPNSANVGLGALATRPRRSPPPPSKRSKHVRLRLTSAQAKKNAAAKRQYGGQNKKSSGWSSKASGMIGGGGATTPRDAAQYVTRRMLSARRIKINELRNELEIQKQTIFELQQENKILRRQKAMQDRALNKYEDTEGDMPQVIMRHGEEVRVMREQLRKQKEKLSVSEKQMRNTQDDLNRAQRQLRKYKDIVDAKGLGERDELARKLTGAEADRDQKDRRVAELERHVENLQKNHKHEIGIERARHRESQRRIQQLEESMEHAKLVIREKDKELDVRNIYTNRGIKPPHRLSSTRSTPAPSFVSLKERKNSEPSALSPRDKSRILEEKRRQEDLLKREPSSKSSKGAKKTPPSGKHRGAWRGGEVSYKPSLDTNHERIPEHEIYQPPAHPANQDPPAKTLPIKTVDTPAYVPTFATAPKPSVAAPSAASTAAPDKPLFLTESSEVTPPRTAVRSPPSPPPTKPLQSKPSFGIGGYSKAVGQAKPVFGEAATKNSEFRSMGPTSKHARQSYNFSGLGESNDYNPTLGSPTRGREEEEERIAGRNQKQIPDWLRASSDKSSKPLDGGTFSEERAPINALSSNRRNRHGNREEERREREAALLREEEAEREREREQEKERQRDRLRSESERQLRDQEERRRDLEEREREHAERERREREEKERRRRDEEEEMERNERERIERERREKEEIERKAELEKQRISNDAAEKERQRQKELLLAKMKAIDDGESPKSASGSKEPDSPSHRSYVFSQPTENMHNGKPAYDSKENSPKKERKKGFLDTDDDEPTFGSYAPTFTSASSKKTQNSIFNDNVEIKPKNASAAKKSNLMAELFGTPSPSKKADKPETSSFVSKGGADSRRGSNLNGGDRKTASPIFTMDSDTGGGMLPRRQRQPATTLSARPAVNAIDDIEDDLEEVVL